MDDWMAASRKVGNSKMTQADMKALLLDVCSVLRWVGAKGRQTADYSVAKKVYAMVVHSGVWKDSSKAEQWAD